MRVHVCVCALSCSIVKDVLLFSKVIMSSHPLKNSVCLLCQWKQFYKYLCLIVTIYTIYCICQPSLSAALVECQSVSQWASQFLQRYLDYSGIFKFTRWQRLCVTVPGGIRCKVWGWSADRSNSVSSVSPVWSLFSAPCWGWIDSSVPAVTWKCPRMLSACKRQPSRVTVGLMEDLYLIHPQMFTISVKTNN